MRKKKVIKRNPRHNPAYEEMKKKKLVRKPDRGIYNEILKKNAQYNIMIESKSVDVVKAFMVIKKWAEKVTDTHINKRDGRGWTLHEQLCHVQSEITEVYEAIRWAKCDREITEEMVDVVFSAFTIFNIYQFNKLRDYSKADYDQLVKESVKNVFTRVNGRLKDPSYNMGSRVGKLEE